MFRVLTQKRIKSEYNCMAASISSWVDGADAGSGIGIDADSLLDSSGTSKLVSIDTVIATAGVDGRVKPASELARTLRKDRLPSDLAVIDALLDGGLARGKISEIIGRLGAGKTSLAALFTAASTQRGEIAAWIDSSGAFDPASLKQAGVILSRVLWINPDRASSAACCRLDPAGQRRGDEAAQFADHLVRLPARRPRGSSYLTTRVSQQWRAAELVLKAGGFGLLVLDLGSYSGMVSRVAALRLARLAEHSATAVLILAQRRVCGSFTAVSLALKSTPRFSRLSHLGAHAPVLFDGLRVEARLARNKLGAPGRSTTWDALAALPARVASPVLSSSRPIAFARAVSG